MNTLRTGTSVALVTGANAGIGKDLARQLARTGRYRTVLMGCRNARKGEEARLDLQRRTGLGIFETFDLDLSSVDAVRAAVARLTVPVDDLVMNAGGYGGEQRFALTRDGVVGIVAANLLGHAALLDGLVSRGLLTRSAVYVGSEAARGVPQMRLARPSLESGSVAEFADVLDGKRFQRTGAGPNAAYAWTKFVAALWIGHEARSHSNLRILTMSPGGTAGTNATDVFPQPLRTLMNGVVMPHLMPLMGMGHSLDVGAKRLLDAVSDDRYRTGAFYASWPKTSGPVSDQSRYFPALADETLQDHAAEAIARFARTGRAAADGATSA